MKPVQLCMCSLLFVLALFGQTKAFDVVSFRVEPPLKGDEGRLYNYSENRGRISYTHISVDNLISRAYDMPVARISGIPRWNEYTLYTLSANLPDGSSNDDVREMLRNLLAEQLRLRVRTQEKDVRGYVLSESSRGSKLKTSHAEPPGPTSEGSSPRTQIDRRKGRMVCTRVPMDQLATLLSLVLERPVVNQTKIEGFFDFDLRWTPETPSADNGAYPSIFAALEEQLGLRVRAQTVSAKYLIVEHVEREPRPE